MVKVTVHTEEVSLQYLEQFDVVVLTDFYDKAKLIEIGDMCHAKSIGFIVADTLGLYVNN